MFLGDDGQPGEFWCQAGYVHDQARVVGHGLQVGEALGADADVQVADGAGVLGADGPKPVAAAVEGGVLGVGASIPVLVAGLEEEEGVGAIENVAGLLGNLLVHLQKTDIKMRPDIFPHVGYVEGSTADGEDVGVYHVADLCGQIRKTPEPRGSIGTLSMWLIAGGTESMGGVSKFGPF